jgi:hypothetical protein
MNRWLFPVLFASAIGCVGLQAQATFQPGAEPCDQAFRHSSAAVLESQQNLLRQKVKDMDADGAPALQVLIAGFKDSLAGATDVILLCESSNTPAEQLQKDLARLLHANQPQPIQSDDRYGGDLKVIVSTPVAAPQLRIVELRFTISCGEDSVLLVYEPSERNAQLISSVGEHVDSGMPNGLIRTLRWQAAPYDQISGAFGDFFQYVLTAGQNEKPWRLVVAHGTPWCTSTWSGFQIDLLEPQPGAPRVVWHDREFYRRGDVAPKLTLRPNGFELRAEVNTIEHDQLFRKGVYRYAVDDDTVRRVQPIATDGRGFVDEWLQAPWSEATDWSLPEGLAGFEKAHEAFERSQKNAGVTYSYGPVRACLMKGQYEVEIDADPGGKQFYAIREGQNGYTLANFGTTQDERCSGPDLMKRQPTQSH